MDLLGKAAACSRRKDDGSRIIPPGSYKNVCSASRRQGKWPISTAGGIYSRWRGDGRELYYVNGSELMAVEIEVRGEELVAGIPR